MKIERALVKRESLESFADTHNLTLSITEREKPDCYRLRYYVDFKHAEIKRDGCLISLTGNGTTEDEAIEDYMKQISGELLIVHAYDKSKRKEIQVPFLNRVYNNKIEYEM